MTDHKAEWVLVPREPTPAMLRVLVCRGREDGADPWEAGKRMQSEQLARSSKAGNYGYQPWMIPPKTEYEVAAGQYIAMLAAAPAASEGEDGAVAWVSDVDLAILRQGASSFVHGQPANDATIALYTRPAAQVAAPAFDMLVHLQRQREWSGRTFGPGPRTAGVVDHIRKELREIEADPTDLSEWIDVVILALDGAWRAGGSPEQIIAALVAKQTKNEGRQWPDWRTADPDKAIEHDRSADAQVAATPKHDEGRDAEKRFEYAWLEATDRYVVSKAAARYIWNAALATQPAARRVTDADVFKACADYTIALSKCGSRLGSKSPHEVAMRAALESFAQPAEGVSRKKHDGPCWRNSHADCGC